MLRGVDAVNSDLNASIKALQAGLLELRTVASFSFLQFTPQLVARACPRRWSTGEPDYVRNVIARRNLAVPFLHTHASSRGSSASDCSAAFAVTGPSKPKAMASHETPPAAAWPAQMAGARRTRRH